MLTYIEVAALLVAAYLSFRFYRESRKVLAQLKQLTQETKDMATAVTISSQSVADLQASDAALKAAVTQVLTFIQQKLGAVPADDTAAVEAAVADITATTSNLLAAINPTPTPTPTPTPAA